MRGGLELARKVGNRFWERELLGFGYASFSLGDWDEVLARQAQLPVEDRSRARRAFVVLLTSIVPVKVNRGDVDDADDDVRLVAELMSPDDQQERAQHSFAEATVLLAKGDAVGALAAAEAALATREANGIGLDAVKEAFVVAVDAALRVGDVSKAENLLAIVEGLPAGRLPQFLRAHASRFRCPPRLPARRGSVQGRGRAIPRARRALLPGGNGARVE